MSGQGRNGKFNSSGTENRKFVSLLRGVFTVVDGRRLLCAEYQNDDMKIACYEGYIQSEEVSNLLVSTELVKSFTRT